MSIKKAIIPAAGYGTRSLPITKAVPKEMFPVAGKPAIQYVVEEAIASGIEEILIVLSRNKSLIMDYFDRSLEYEAFLEKVNKQHLIGKIDIPDIHLQYIRQPFAEGLGAAVKLGRRFAGNEPFAVLLPDDIFIGDEPPALAQLSALHKETGLSVIGLKKVKKDLLKNYGVIKEEKLSEGKYRLIDIVEKPKKSPPSNLAVSGRYIFTPSLFDHLEKTTKGAGGELQLTDAVKSLLKEEKCYGIEISRNRYDIGSEADYLKLIQTIMESGK
ncbi:UTP--glucose-1-phosphate uridylyltransferase [Evansella clarkii]|uniref:UTP--glucose-1-phosphate uridylyltransferase n=1 Tax=Evansella clarkii TaxID=79879 RepID=UPI000997B1C4|nr:UTP--glucose-1-phosphate uridylyltransferase [Evansella clarkii]